MENVAQAINSDVSAFYMIEANAQIAPVVHHCHDEFTLEVDEATAHLRRAELEELTKNRKPDWAKGLPLGFDYWVGRRYGK